MQSAQTLNGIMGRFGNLYPDCDHKTAQLALKAVIVASTSP